jgi:antitoxin ParD1/3/4
MNVSLPDSLRDWIETQTRVGGHADVNHYVEQVLRAEQERIHHEIERKLIEGLESGEPIEVNAAFWAERRRVLEDCLRNHAKESA